MTPKEYIKKHALDNEYTVPETDEEFFEYVREGDLVEELDPDTHRWWTEFIGIYKIGDRYFGVIDATSDGDMTASEKGWEPYDYDITEYHQVEEMTKVWKVKE